MFTLKKNGYQTISIEDFYQFVNGTKKLPKKSFLLTFDDGRKESFYPADPVLKVLDYSAVMYVITEHVDSNSTKKSHYYLSADEIRMAMETGRWEIGSHGCHDHDPIIIDASGTKGSFMSNKKWLPELKRSETDQEFSDRILKDLIESKNDIKNLFGVDPISYAFPRGDYGIKDCQGRSSG